VGGAAKEQKIKSNVDFIKSKTMNSSPSFGRNGFTAAESVLVPTQRQPIEPHVLPPSGTDKHACPSLPVPPPLDTEQPIILTPENRVTLCMRLFDLHTSRAEALNESRRQLDKMNRIKQILATDLTIHNLARVTVPGDNRFVHVKHVQRIPKPCPELIYDVLRAEHGETFADRVEAMVENKLKQQARTVVETRIGYGGLRAKNERCAGVIRSVHRQSKK
jgi:hypothetical protein